MGMPVRNCARVKQNMNQDIEQLESKLAYLELAFEELNQVVYEQGRRLDKALEQVAELKGQLKSVLEENAERPYSPEEELPPHY